MRLSSISISRYRSINDANKIALGSYTALIGANNEGKSNILRALNLAMSIIQYHGEAKAVGRAGFINIIRERGSYEWSRDFPIGLQGKPKGSKETRIRIDFQLDDADAQEFTDLTGSTIDGNLPIEITIGESLKPNIQIKKQGPYSENIKSKTVEICNYISSKIFVNYIPSVRTKSETARIVSELLGSQMNDLEKDPAYQNAIDQIRDLQAPILARISEEIKSNLQSFVPNVKDVKIFAESRRIMRAVSREPEIIIDDGTPTLLEYKGDGIQSLVALSMFQNAGSDDRTCIYAVEEPESHLHSGAIHELRHKIIALSASAQVIVSTHSPIFIDRSALACAVLVRGGVATKAKNVDEIREALGVRVSDNLKSAEFVIYVEGDNDIPFVSKIIARSPKLTYLAAQKRLVIQGMGGGTNIRLFASGARNDVIGFHFLVDNDDAGREGVERAEREGLIRPSNYNLMSYPGFAQSEAEDLIDPNVYRSVILEEFGVTLDRASFNGNRKWSDRMAAAFLANGKIWNKPIEIKVKNHVSNALKDHDGNVFKTQSEPLLETIIETLERLVSTE